MVLSYLLGDWILETVFQVLNSGLLQYVLSSSRAFWVSISDCLWYSSSVSRRRGSSFFGFSFLQSIYSARRQWLRCSPYTWTAFIKVAYSLIKHEDLGKRVLHVLGAECSYHDGQSHLLDLSSSVHQQKAEDLQRPGQDVDTSLIHKGAIAVTHCKTDEPNHNGIT